MYIYIYSKYHIPYIYISYSKYHIYIYISVSQLLPHLSYPAQINITKNPPAYTKAKIITTKTNFIL